ncbi:hypothetical protein N574_03820 [Lactiplantibacillus plantarum 2165]|nr:hypothetical protein N574_03820 [Lactiplantibacillus plantarum 2165]
MHLRSLTITVDHPFGQLFSHLDFLLNKKERVIAD